MAKITSAIGEIYNLEDLSSKNSSIHKLHPISKLFVTIIYAFAVISVNKYDLSTLIMFAAYPVLLCALAEIPYKLLFKRVLIALPFVFFAGIFNVFIDTKPALLANAFGVKIIISFGVISFITLMFKALLTVSGVLILIATTKLNDLSKHLVKLKVPKLIIQVLNLTYRYISVLIEEASSMYTAYKLRAPHTKGIKIKDIGTFLGQLLIRSIDKSENIYFAMKLRGFENIYTVSCLRKMSTTDYLFILTIIASIVVISFI